ncbi:MAG: DNA primase [Planctomycetota bacterium]
MNNVDDLVHSTSLESVLSAYGKLLPKSSSGEHRMDCVFNEACSESTYGQLSIDQNSKARLIYCHSCGVRGNLLTLIHGLETGRPPAGGRLKGDEFLAASKRLQNLSDSSGQQQTRNRTPESKPAADKPVEKNVPLRVHEKEAARKIEDLYKDLVTDLSVMPPNTASYFRQRPWLTPEVCEKWGVGYVPKNGRSLFKRYVVYTHRDQRDNVLSYSGRDAGFPAKWEKWIADGRPEGKQPTKHKFVSGYKRGLELYGQQSKRLQEPRLVESLKKRGLVICEGPNDVIRLDCLGVCAVGLCTNKATSEQIEKTAAFSKQVANSRVVLMHDNEPEGIEGFKPLAWELMQRGLSVQIGWPNDPVFLGKQPEDISVKDLDEIDRHLGVQD